MSLTIQKNKFIIPSFFYKGKYLDVMNSDKERWDKALTKYKEAWEHNDNKFDEMDDIPF